MSSPAAPRGVRDGPAALKLLRPAHAASLVSAQVFDGLFARNLAPALAVEQVDLLRWCDEVLGHVDGARDLDAAARAFAAATAGFDALCPDSHAIALAPLLLALRNRAGAPIRLLLIAHAPGAYGLEWALLGPLLAAGDRIVAPTESAREVIALLSPPLAAHVRVIPHPIHALTAAAVRSGTRLVSLSRLHPSKLIHRQLDAMALLRARGHRSLRMQIAGPLHVPGARETSSYARALAARIDRLGLSGHVELLGTLAGDAPRAALLAGARALVNLSVTIEESFGKAIVEAQTVGTPAVITRWDGLPETVGPAGVAAPVEFTQRGVDAGADAVADALERLLDQPWEPDVCREQARRAAPELVRTRYRAMIEEALAERDASAGPRDAPTTAPAAPPAGLLGRSAPLVAYGWHELFAVHVEDTRSIRRILAGEPPAQPGPGEHLRNLVIAAVRPALERQLAGLDPAAQLTITGTGRDEQVAAATLADRIARASFGPATLRSRLFCVEWLAQHGLLAPVRASLARLHDEGASASGIDYLAVEADLLDGQFGAALQRSIASEGDAEWDESAVSRVRQLARVARAAGLPEVALPWLRDWLARHPDGPGAGLVWVDLAVHSLCAEPEQRGEAREAYAAAVRLLGDWPQRATLADALHGAPGSLAAPTDPETQ